MRADYDHGVRFFSGEGRRREDGCTEEEFQEAVHWERVIENLFGLGFKNLTQFGVVKMPGAVEASGSITKLKHRCRHTTA